MYIHIHIKRIQNDCNVFIVSTLQWMNLKQQLGFWFQHVTSSRFRTANVKNVYAPKSDRTWMRLRSVFGVQMTFKRWLTGVVSALVSCEPSSVDPPYWGTRALAASANRKRCESHHSFAIGASHLAQKCRFRLEASQIVRVQSMYADRLRGQFYQTARLRQTILLLEIGRIDLGSRYA